MYPHVGITLVWNEKGKTFLGFHGRWIPLMFVHAIDDHRVTHMRYYDEMDKGLWQGLGRLDRVSRDGFSNELLHRV